MVERPKLFPAFLVRIVSSEEVDDCVALAMLKILLEKIPGVLRRVRARSYNILHQVALLKTSRAVEISRLVIQALPELVLEHGGSGNQPLHLACALGNLNVVKCILDACPGAIRSADGNGTFPIHFAINALSLSESSDAAVEVVQYLLAVDPSVESLEPSCPLLLACGVTKQANLSAGLEVIESLYNVYPEAIVNDEASFRRGIDRGSFVDEVQSFLIEQFRYATQASDLQLINTQDDNGRLPIHNALLRDAHLGSIKLLVQADPPTLQIRDIRGSLPLHIACERYASNVVDFLVNVNRSLLVSDDQGNAPLHCACLAANYDVIDLLLTKYPTAPASAWTRNLDGDLPIQLLANSLGYNDQESIDKYMSSIFLLLRANPDIWMNDVNIAFE